ncbi:MAG TPA: pyruvate ferredoxin oxidoreductase [bacterium]|nr:pyruvate ferredoxin oxidoreductase [bacterium]
MASNLKNKLEKKLLEGSRAIALTINNIEPQVISAYPITPQTHIVEDLAKFKSNGQANYEYIRAESEFAAASIVLGASAKGVRTYSATSSQGLLLMTEVIYNISGMRLPVVMTLANRAISAPINIWNDQQDAMAIRDAGWIMLMAENNQEAVWQHLLAYKIAEKTGFPVFVNVDGFILTHCFEPVYIPDKKIIKKFLPDYKPLTGNYLDTNNPVTLGAFLSPQTYQTTREKMYNEFQTTLKEINKEYINLQKIINEKTSITNNGLIEYLGPKKAKTIIIAMGSIIGTIKTALKDKKDIGILKIKTYRPFPKQEIYDIIKEAKNILVLEKAISFGNFSPLYLDVKTISSDKQIIKNFIGGLGGRDITEKTILEIITKFNSFKKINFI